jgi:ligand-binding SRPBCC domain-containing protein
VRPVSEVFSFCADAGNLDVITPPWLRFQILTPRPMAMRVGAQIDYRLRLRGLPLRWQSEITVWQPPHRFVDEQRRGPYRAWRHEHTFTAQDGGTLVGDRVRYAVLGGRWLTGCSSAATSRRFSLTGNRNSRRCFDELADWLSQAQFRDEYRRYQATSGMFWPRIRN